MLFRSKQYKIQNEIKEYCQEVTLCLESMCTTFERCCGIYDCSMLEEQIREIHRHEGRADDIRREVEVMMYSKSIFPESRGDILGLLEAMDQVPNQAEDVVFMLKTHHIVIPSDFQAQVLELAGKSRLCVSALLEGVSKLFDDFTNATVAIGKVDRLESECDVLEMHLTDQVFSSELNGTKKILMRDLIQALAGVADRAESAGDRVRIIVAKRSI